ncbi:MAG: ester cyclase [Rhodobacter sp.]|nr:ester cyclase [Rhodobacter sp.]
MPLPPGTKTTAHDLLCRLARGAPVADIYHADAVWNGVHPFGTVEGTEAIAPIWADLRRALPDMERRDLIFVGGENQPDPRLTTWRAPHLVAAIGHLQGTFVEDYLDIPATYGVVHLRYAEAHHVEDGRIRHSWVMLDLLDLMRQAGIWPLPPSLGHEGMWPGPASQDGLRLDDGGPSDSLDTVLNMHAALIAFDGRDLSSMPHERYWTEHFMYYAGSGIGMTRGLEGFRAHHQIPFLSTFPDRGARGHFIRIADGPYAVTGGVVYGTDSGEIMGMPATGKVIDVKVMDFYRLTPEGLIAENWLPIDVIGMAHQMGYDILARLRHYRGNPRRTL